MIFAANIFGTVYITSIRHLHQANPVLDPTVEKFDPAQTTEWFRPIVHKALQVPAQLTGSKTASSCAKSRHD